MKPQRHLRGSLTNWITVKQILPVSISIRSVACFSYCKLKETRVGWLSTDYVKAYVGTTGLLGLYAYQKTHRIKTNTTRTVKSNSRQTHKNNLNLHSSFIWIKTNDFIGNFHIKRVRIDCKIIANAIKRKKLLQTANCNWICVKEMVPTPPNWHCLEHPPIIQLKNLRIPRPRVTDENPLCFVVKIILLLRPSCNFDSLLIVLNYVFLNIKKSRRPKLVFTWLVTGQICSILWSFNYGFKTAGAQHVHYCNSKRKMVWKQQFSFRCRHFRVQSWALGFESIAIRSTITILLISELNLKF